MKRILFFCLLFGAVANIMGKPRLPRLPRYVKAKSPEILDRTKLPKMEELQQELCNGSKWGQDKQVIEKVWVVYSDRDDNPTYTAPDKAARFGELRFGEKVCIAEIKNDMAHVYSDEKARYPVIPKGTKSKGWIPLDNLLLWQKCPTDHRGVQMKGIIAINLNRMAKDEKYPQKKYNSPDNLSKCWSLNTDLAFCFFMKETPDGEFALLATSPNIGSSQQLYGWVSKNAFTQWNQRLCLEPNWTPKYNETHRGERAYIYDNSERTSFVTYWEFGNNNGDKNLLYQYRMKPSQLRFPILEQPDENGMVLCTSFITSQAGYFHPEYFRRTLGENGYKAWLQVRGIFAYNGYAHIDDLGDNDYWKAVIFLSGDELRELLEDLEGIGKAIVDQNTDRILFVNAILALLKTKLGSSFTDNEIMTMPSEELENAIYGINVKLENMRFTKYSLSDLSNREVVSDNDYFDTLDRFEKKLKNLKEMTTGYKYRMEVDRMWYYWIPIEDLP